MQQDSSYRVILAWRSCSSPPSARPSSLPPPRPRPPPHSPGSGPHGNTTEFRPAPGPTPPPRQPGPSPHHVGAGLVLVQPAGLVLDQLLAAVAHRGPAAARLLGRVDQTLAVRGPGAGRVEDLPRLHPADLTVRQKVAHKLLPLERWRRSMR